MAFGKLVKITIKLGQEQGQGQFQSLDDDLRSSFVEGRWPSLLCSTVKHFAFKPAHENVDYASCRGGSNREGVDQIRRDFTHHLMTPIKKLISCPQDECACILRSLFSRR
jgi:hypothetical protein